MPGKTRIVSNGGEPADIVVEERLPANVDLPTTPTDLNPRPDVPYEGPVEAYGPLRSGGAGGRTAEFGAGQAAAQDVSGEVLGFRGSPNHTYGYAPDPEPGAHWQGRPLPPAIHRPDFGPSQPPLD